MSVLHRLNVLRDKANKEYPHQYRDEYHNAPSPVQVTPETGITDYMRYNYGGTNIWCFKSERDLEYFTSFYDLM